MKAILLLFPLVLLFIFSTAQTTTHTAPTLQVGLDGLAFGKGSLDSELILQIIAEKQDEIKIRVAQNILLQPLNDCGATIYAFGDNILRAVIEEKDPIIRKRKILESTVNTLFAVGFAKYYLFRIENDPSTKYKVQLEALKSLHKLILKKDYKRIINNEVVPGIWKKNGSKLQQTDNQNSKGQIRYFSTILDIASQAGRNNATLTKLGIENISYSKTYDYQSNFLNHELGSNSTAQDELDFKKYAQTLYNGMKSELEILTQLIGASKFLLDEKNLRIISPTINTNAFSITGMDINYSEIISLLNELPQYNIDSIKFVKISKIYNYLDKIKNRGPLTSGDYSDIIYTFSNEFIPLIENLGISKSQTFKLISKFRESSKISTNKLLQNKILKVTLEFLAKAENIDFFTNLLSRLYEFDKGSTYIEYFNLISEISNFLDQDPDFKNPKVKESLSYFNTFVKDYVVISETQKGKDYIDFNVQSFLGHLSEMQTNKPQRISLLFDVGISTGYFTQNAFQISPGLSLKNISFVAEKFGVKWKVIDYGFWKRKSPGETYRNYRNYIKESPPKEPVINNIFISLYGTGLLYNIFDVSTENEFDSPFLGAAFGLGFFNNFDLSLSAAVPIISDQSFSQSFNYPLLSVNFDFRFNEYIQRLGEKRNAAQIQKALAKAEVVR